VIGDERARPGRSVSVAAGKLFSGGNLTVETANAGWLMSAFHAWRRKPKRQHVVRREIRE
jgi:hypothetical protein